TTYARQCFDGGIENLLGHLLAQRHGAERCRTIGAHTPGVWSRIAIPKSFMILRGQHRYHWSSVHEGHDRQFFAVKKLFDQHTLAGLTKHGMLHRITDG